MTRVRPEELLAEAEVEVEEFRAWLEETGQNGAHGNIGPAKRSVPCACRRGRDAHPGGWCRYCGCVLPKRYVGDEDEENKC